MRLHLSDNSPAAGASLLARCGLLLLLSGMLPLLASCTYYESQTRVEHERDRNDDDDYADDHVYYDPPPYYGREDHLQVYHYYPECDVYYHTVERIYVYRDNGHWYRVRHLPPAWGRRIDNRHYVVVRIDGDHPERWHDSVRRDYDRGRWDHERNNWNRDRHDHDNDHRDHDNDRHRDHDNDRDRHDDKNATKHMLKEDKQRDKHRPEVDRRYVQPQNNHDDHDRDHDNDRNRKSDARPGKGQSDVDRNSSEKRGPDTGRSVDSPRRGGGDVRRPTGPGRRAEDTTGRLKSTPEVERKSSGPDSRRLAAERSGDQSTRQAQPDARRSAEGAQRRGGGERSSKGAAVVAPGAEASSGTSKGRSGGGGIDARGR